MTRKSAVGSNCTKVAAREVAEVCWHAPLLSVPDEDIGLAILVGGEVTDV